MEQTRSKVRSKLRSKVRTKYGANYGANYFTKKRDYTDAFIAYQYLNLDTNI